MIDIILDLIFTPSKVWIGTFLGILVAACIWFFLPESNGNAKDYLSMGAIVVGFLTGLILSSSDNLTK